MKEILTVIDRLIVDLAKIRLVILNALKEPKLTLQTQSAKVSHVSNQSEKSPEDTKSTIEDNNLKTNKMPNIKQGSTEAERRTKNENDRDDFRMTVAKVKGETNIHASTVERNLPPLKYDINSLDISSLDSLDQINLKKKNSEAFGHTNYSGSLEKIKRQSANSRRSLKREDAEIDSPATSKLKVLELARSVQRSSSFTKKSLKEYIENFMQTDKENFIHEYTQTDWNPDDTYCTRKGHLRSEKLMESGTQTNPGTTKIIANYNVLNQVL